MPSLSCETGQYSPVLKLSSIGLKSGEYRGRKSNMQPARVMNFVQKQPQSGYSIYLQMPLLDGEHHSYEWDNCQEQEYFEEAEIGSSWVAM